MLVYRLTVVHRSQRVRAGGQGATVPPTQATVSAVRLSRLGAGASAGEESSALTQSTINSTQACSCKVGHTARGTGPPPLPPHADGCECVRPATYSPTRGDTPFPPSPQKLERTVRYAECTPSLPEHSAICRMHAFPSRAQCDMQNACLPFQCTVQYAECTPSLPEHSAICRMHAFRSAHTQLPVSLRHNALACGT